MPSLKAPSLVRTLVDAYGLSSSGVQCKRCARSATPARLRPPELNLSTPSAAHIEHYARIVLQHAVRRRYIDAAQQVAELAWNQRKDLETVKQRAEALVGRLERHAEQTRRAAAVRVDRAPDRVPGPGAH